MITKEWSTKLTLIINLWRVQENERVWMRNIWLCMRIIHIIFLERTKKSYNGSVYQQVSPKRITILNSMLGKRFGYNNKFMVRSFSTTSHVFLPNCIVWYIMIGEHVIVISIWYGFYGKGCTFFCKVISCWSKILHREFQPYVVYFLKDPIVPKYNPLWYLNDKKHAQRAKASLSFVVIQSLIILLLFVKTTCNVFGIFNVPFEYIYIDFIKHDYVSYLYSISHGVLQWKTILYVFSNKMMCN